MEDVVALMNDVILRNNHPISHNLPTMLRTLPGTPAVGTTTYPRARSLYLT